MSAFDDKLLGFQNHALSVMNADGSGAHVLTAALDRDVGHPRWSADGHAIFVSYTDHGVTKVARVGLDGKVSVVASGLAAGEIDRPYAGGSYSVARDGAVAFAAGDPAHPPEGAVATRAGVTRRLTSLKTRICSRAIRWER